MWLEHVTSTRHHSLIMVVSSSSYIIYLFHTTFEGFAKALLHKIPVMANTENDIIFSIGAFFVISCGVIFPILLYEFVLKRYNITRILFGLKPVKKA